MLFLFYGLEIISYWSHAILFWFTLTKYDFVRALIEVSDCRSYLVVLAMNRISFCFALRSEYYQVGDFDFSSDLTSCVVALIIVN